MHPLNDEYKIIYYSLIWLNSNVGIIFKRLWRAATFLCCYYSNVTQSVTTDRENYQLRYGAFVLRRCPHAWTHSRPTFLIMSSPGRKLHQPNKSTSVFSVSPSQLSSTSPSPSPGPKAQGPWPWSSKCICWQCQCSRSLSHLRSFTVHQLFKQGGWYAVSKTHHKFQN